jgi:hypothetical protein
MDNWNAEELEGAVDAYLDMLDKQKKGQKVHKKAIYDDLARRFRRSSKSYEFRMQNISSVMEELGLPWVKGLKPARHVGTNVKADLAAILKTKGYEKGRAPEDSGLGSSVTAPIVQASSRETEAQAQGTEISLSGISGRLDENGEFDPQDDSDGRNRILTSIAQRRGQAKFRKALLIAYGGRCAITGTSCESVLEAAHIKPYRGDHTNHVTNGLLLRADIHTLFDVSLISVSPTTFVAAVPSTLRDDQYLALSGKRIHLPENADQRPNIEALTWHYEQTFKNP